MLASARDAPIAATIPITVPIVTNVNPCRMMRRITSVAVAPIAMRMPISRVRCETE